MSFFCCWRVRYYGSHSSQTDQPRCSTLQGQSLRCYLRHLTSYRSLWYSTNKKLFQWHLVCHIFLSIPFAFHGCSRSVEVLKLLLRLKTNQKNLENPSQCLMKTKKQMLNRIKSTNWNPIRSDPDFVNTALFTSLKVILSYFRSF